MTYHHKRKRCVPDTNDIVQNIFLVDASEYHLVSGEIMARLQSSREPTTEDEGIDNVLPEGALFNLDNQQGKTKKRENRNTAENRLEDLDQYMPTHLVDIEVTEIKEESEKKKKRRNYVEFRSDYRKKKGAS